MKMRSVENMRKVAEEFELTLAEDLQGKFKDWKEAEECWANLRKGPMGTALGDDNVTNLEEGVVNGKLQDFEILSKGEQ
jgi:hypothetical protein